MTKQDLNGIVNPNHEKEAEECLKYHGLCKILEDVEVRPTHIRVGIENPLGFENTVLKMVYSEIRNRRKAEELRTPQNWMLATLKYAGRVPALDWLMSDAKLVNSAEHVCNEIIGALNNTKTPDSMTSNLVRALWKCKFIEQRGERIVPSAAPEGCTTDCENCPMYGTCIIQHVDNSDSTVKYNNVEERLLQAGRWLRG